MSSASDRRLALLRLVAGLSEKLGRDHLYVDKTLDAAKEGGIAYESRDALFRDLTALEEGGFLDVSRPGGNAAPVLFKVRQAAFDAVDTSAEPDDTSDLDTAVKRIKSMLVAYVTAKSPPDMNSDYRDLYTEVDDALAKRGITNPNLHSTLEEFKGYCLYVVRWFRTPGAIS